MLTHYLHYDKLNNQDEDQFSLDYKDIRALFQEEVGQKPNMRPGQKATVKHQKLSFDLFPELKRFGGQG